MNVCVMDTVVSSSTRTFYPKTYWLLAGGAWPVCPHVYPSVSGLSLERCGLKDGEQEDEQPLSRDMVRVSGLRDCGKTEPRAGGPDGQRSNTKDTPKCISAFLFYVVAPLWLKGTVHLNIKIQSSSAVFTLMLTESRVKFCRPQNISGASERNFGVVLLNN